jgi:hypothetical protein
MPRCTVCQHELQKPPDDVRDWFRCEQCGTPLQIPSVIGKILFGISTAVLLVACWMLPIILRRYFQLTDFPIYLMLGSIAAIYGFLGRIVWKTKLTRPRPYDPYSSLNLSDERKKLRGRG